MTTTPKLPENTLRVRNFRLCNTYLTSTTEAMQYARKSVAPETVRKYEMFAQTLAQARSQMDNFEWRGAYFLPFCKCCHQVLIV